MKLFQITLSDNLFDELTNLCINENRLDLFNRLTIANIFKNENNIAYIKLSKDEFDIVSIKCNVIKLEKDFILKKSNELKSYYNNMSLEYTIELCKYIDSKINSIHLLEINSNMYKNFHDMLFSIRKNQSAYYVNDIDVIIYLSNIKDEDIL